MLSLLAPNTPYLVLAGAFAVLGAGMGVTAAPATGEIMSAVPLSKAGVGSAVNDTTRELGGALGIAILGSIANTAYRATINLGGLGLGATTRRHGEESIGAAARVAGAMPGGGALRSRAAVAFTDAFNLASAVSVGIVVLAAIVVLVLAQRGRDDRVEERLDETAAFDLATVPVGAVEASQ
jgi:MFS transporter, DHA2 family, multidrug resistance protein